MSIDKEYWFKVGQLVFIDLEYGFSAVYLVSLLEPKVAWTDLFFGGLRLLDSVTHKGKEVSPLALHPPESLALYVEQEAVLLNKAHLGAECRVHSWTPGAAFRVHAEWRGWVAPVTAEQAEAMIRAARDGISALTVLQN